MNGLRPESIPSHVFDEASCLVISTYLLRCKPGEPTPEGVFVESKGEVLFKKLERPQRLQLEAILQRVASKTLAMVRRRGLLDQEPRSDALANYNGPSGDVPIRTDATRPSMVALLCWRALRQEPTANGRWPPAPIELDDLSERAPAPPDRERVAIGLAGQHLMFDSLAEEHHQRVQQGRDIHWARLEMQPEAPTLGALPGVVEIVDCGDPATSAPLEAVPVTLVSGPASPVTRQLQFGPIEPEVGLLIELQPQVLQRFQNGHQPQRRLASDEPQAFVPTYLFGLQVMHPIANPGGNKAFGGSRRGAGLREE
jgi:hypothetical protein